MEKRNLKTLLKYLSEYKESLDFKNEELIKSIEIIILDVDDRIKNKSRIKSKDRSKEKIYDLIELYEKGDFVELNNHNIKLDFENFEDIHRIVSILDLSNLHKYTVNELKIIYFAISNQKDSYAFKRVNKEEVINEVKNIVLDYKRSSKLLKRSRQK